MVKLRIADREHEHYLHETRESMLETFDNWHTRIEDIHRMIRGEWSVRYPDGSTKTMDPLVMNLLDTMPRDVARLVSESAPSVNARPLSDNMSDIANASVREQIAETYWEANKGELLIPQHAM